ncbi:MAG: SPFH domain-containing protein [Sphingobacteriia bacterium]|jgi:regulator of protease activity HflC (stomatin/prohibitin superfamily)
MIEQIVVYAVLALLGLIVVFGSFYIVTQQTVAIVERFGRFRAIGRPGLNLKLPLIDRVVARMSMRVMQLEVTVETKTRDDVFVTIQVSVQYLVMPERVYDAYYRLSNVHDQVTSYVFDVVRARVPEMPLDDVFGKKDEIATAVKAELEETMNDFGYRILYALVTDINPDDKVKQAMNEINAATRLRIAANEKGEADKILKVKAAQADAESKALQGKGVADQRMAIIEGLQQSIQEFEATIKGSNAQEIMTLVLMTQYFDTLQAVAEHSNNTTIMIPSTPGGLGDLTEQIRSTLIMANQVPGPGTAGKA